jgi:tight adherence protein C
MSIGLVVGVALGVVGAVTIYAGARQQRMSAGPVAYLQQLDVGAQPDVFQERLRQPFLRRLISPLGKRAVARIAAAVPSSYLDRTHQTLLHAGLNARITAEEFVAAQAVSTTLGVLGASVFILAVHPPSGMGVLLLLLGALIGLLGPPSWLGRTASTRELAILNDLPDVLDLLAIAVEAGTALEQAMAIAGTHFTSPLADELVLTLREMELGLSRRQALQNLKRRTDVAELSNVVAVLIQAEALGMPIGRILHTQSREVRDRRRQRIREKAAKLPVKILFPLLLFIFPAIFVILLGPAVISITHIFKK